MALLALYVLSHVAGLLNPPMPARPAAGYVTCWRPFRDAARCVDSHGQVLVLAGQAK